MAPLYLANQCTTAVDQIDGIDKDGMPTLITLNGNFTDSHQQTLVESLSVKTKIQPQNIVNGFAQLQKRISDILEEQVRDGFLKIQGLLKRFESTERNSMEIGQDILESDEVTKTIFNLLFDSYSREDLLKLSKGGNLDEASIVVNQLCAAIRCAAVPPLARKYNQQLWICKSLLHTIKFQEALAEKTSKDDIMVYLRSDPSRLHLDKIKKVDETFKPNMKSYRLPQDHLHNIQEEMKVTFMEMEKKFLGMKRISVVFKRILLETNGYIKQTNLGLSVPDSEMFFSPHVSYELRKELLTIKEVYGLGTVYGKLEIHVDLEIKDVKHKSVDSVAPNDKMNNGNNKKSDELRMYLYKEIAAIVKKHCFYHPYIIKAVQRKATKANRIFEPGTELRSPIDGGSKMKLGTIGGYILSKEGKLYGLTCKHVLGDNGTIYVDNGKTLLGRYHESLDAHFIDIAAVEVDPVLQEQCKRNLKNDMRRISQVQLLYDPKQSLKGEIVHKFGAATGLTRGIILSRDYSSLNTDDLDYEVIIDPLVMDSGNDIDEEMETFKPLPSIPHNINATDKTENQSLGIGGSPTSEEEKAMPAISTSGENCKGTRNISEVVYERTCMSVSGLTLKVTKQPSSGAIPIESNRTESQSLEISGSQTSEEEQTFPAKSTSGETCIGTLNNTGNISIENNQSTCMLASGGTLTVTKQLGEKPLKISSMDQSKSETMTFCSSNVNLSSGGQKQLDGIEKLRSDIVPAGRTYLLVDESTLTTADKACGEFKVPDICNEEKIIYKRTEAANMGNDTQIMREENHNCKTKITVYVRDINGETDFEDNKSCDRLFSDEGDSGAIICTPDPRYNGLAYLAVSMLIGAKLEIGEDLSQKTVSLMLQHGLDHICKKCNINFQ